MNFDKKHSTSHALIHLTDKNSEQLDNEKYSCGVFFNFQKAFNTVDHAILAQKLEYHDVRGNVNNWFSSCLKNRTRFVTIAVFNSSLKQVNCGFLQELVLGPLNFTKFIILMMTKI